VRVIEHGTLIDDATARHVAEKGSFIVPRWPSSCAYRDGPILGFPTESQKKVEYVFQQALAGMASMRTAGVKIGFGTDLLGETYRWQPREFTIRKQVFSRWRYYAKPPR